MGSKNIKMSKRKSQKSNLRKYTRKKSKKNRIMKGGMEKEQLDCYITDMLDDSNYISNTLNLTIYTLRAGFKKKGKDLLIIVFDKAVPVANAYSQTSMPSAPIIWDKKNNNSFCKVLIVNSGNANAHTGTRGINQIEKYTKVASKIFQCKKSEILVSSTGVIGEKLDSIKIIKKLNCISKNSLKSV